MQKSYKIKKITALEVLDSRGNPTLMCEVGLENGISGQAYVPSGASTGKYEALELRDNDKQRFGGLGVLKACENVKTKIAPRLKGKDVRLQKEIDETMLSLDGTKNKSRLGANAILGVSLACAKAAAYAQNQPLYQYLNELFCKLTKTSLSIKTFPTPMLNVINGGKHADSGLDIQEFMLVPEGNNFRHKLQRAVEIYQALKKVIIRLGYTVGVGDEGGFAPKLETNFQALEILNEAVNLAGYKIEREVNFALDCAASEFYDEKEKKYILRRPYASLAADQLLAMYLEWQKKFSIISYEDPFAEEDYEGWKRIMEKNSNNKTMIVGDDLFVTNITRLKRGIEDGLANAILIKPNQIGTLSETFECIKLAKENNYKIIISHRSGETCSSFIADLAVACQADYVKFGAPARGERIAKYNRLLEIENKLF